MKRWTISAGIVLIAIGVLIASGVVAARRGWQPPAPLRFLAAWADHSSGSGSFCREHGVPEKFCTLCHEDLKTSLLMCQQHGLPEDICTLCHPEVAEKYGLKTLCKEHGLPSSFCTRCNPSLAAAQIKSDWCPEHGVPESLCIRCRPALAKLIEMCEEHGVPEALCTICHPELAQNFTVCKPHRLPAAICPDPDCQAAAKRLAAASKLCPQHGSECKDVTCKFRNGPNNAKASLPLVRLSGPDIAAKSGIQVESPKQGTVTPKITVNGEVGYDEARLAHVRPRVAGLIHEVRVKPGDNVRDGQLLAVIDSAELGQAKADYLAAQPLVDLWQQTLTRLRGLTEQGIIAEKQVIEAEAELRRAKAELIRVGQRLRNFHFTDSQMARLADEDSEQRNFLQITAPISGTIVRRRAVAGESVEPMTDLFTVTDLSRVWVQLDVYERDLARIRVGQSVVFRVAGLAPNEFNGEVAWIDAEVNDLTRTIRVRAEVENTNGLLRANMFGKGEIQIGEPHRSMLVPRDAVQWEGSSFVVFVPTAPDQFEPRRVLLGSKVQSPAAGTSDRADHVELTWADLRPGERVATAGSFLLKSEILKSAIGAGCCAPQ